MIKKLLLTSACSNSKQINNSTPQVMGWSTKVFYAFLLLVSFQISVYSQSSTTQVINTTGNGSFTVPCGVTSLTVEAWGAGGAGGGSTTDNRRGGGGGAGGTYVKSVLTVTPGEVLNYSVAPTRTGRTDSGLTGAATWFSNASILYAEGGPGGAAPAGDSDGTNVQGSIANSKGEIKIAGSTGGSGTNNEGGKGGQGANNGGFGGAVRNSNGGDGNSGAQPGGGGGGAFVNDATDRIGGAGGAGLLKITYSTPNEIKTTGVSVCQGGTGSLQASTGVTTFSGSWATDGPVATRPIGEGGTGNITSCTFEEPNKRNYSYILFQVSVSGSYEFRMADTNAYDGMGYIVTENFTPGVCSTGNWIIGDDDESSGGGKEPRMTANLVAGTVYKLVSTTYGSTATYQGTYIWTVTPPSGGLVYLNPTVKWYTAATGGTAIATGSTFNPVGVAGSGLTNTNTPGTTTYYAGYGDNAACTRTPADFVITPTVTTTTGRVGANPYGVFCIDAPTTIPTTAVNSGQYVSLDIVKGYNYTFSVGNVFASDSETLTIVDNSGANLATPVSVSGATGASISNWVATVSGRVRIVLSSSTCTSGTTGGPLTLTLNSANNTVDNPLAMGTNSWIGHVYDFSNSVTPIPPNDADAFKNYLGYFSQSNTVSGNTKSFTQNYGGNEACFNVTAGGTTQSVRTETFAVRYLMQTTAAVYPAGCYFVNVTGDDGVRLFIDDVRVFNEWIQQGTTNYTNVLVSLSGTSKLRFEYYEKNGGNISNFTISPVDPSINYIVNNSPINRCASDVTVLDGSQIVYKANTNTANPSIKFQWQSSTDNSTFTNINPNGTAEDYTIPTTVPTVTTTIYYRRIASGVNENSSACLYPTTSVAVTTAPNASVASVSGTSPLCAGQTATYTANSVVLSGGTGAWSSNNTSVATVNASTGLVTGVASGTATITYTITGGCGGVKTATRIVTVNSLPSAPVTTAATARTCFGFTANWGAVTNATTYLLDVSTESDFSSFVEDYEAKNVGNVVTSVVAVSGGTYYYRVRAVNLCGVSLNSNTTTASPLQVPIPVITSAEGTCNGVKITWEASEGATYYVLTYDDNELMSSPESITLDNVTEFEGNDLVTGQQYWFTVSAGNFTTGCGTSPPSNEETVVVGNVTEFTGIVLGSEIWSNGEPDATKSAVFSADYTIDADMAACSVRVSSGAVVTVNTGITLTVTNKVTVETDENLIFENNASLVQINDVENSGKIIYKRTSQPMNNFDFTYWGSPVAGQNIIDLSPNTLSDKYNQFNPETGWFLYKGDMVPGIGYNIRVPKAGLWPNGENVSFPYPQPVEFIGVPNNGTIDGEVVVSGRNYLVGNPYPSALDADKFLEANKDWLEGTIYFWTHKTPISTTPNASGQYIYSSNDFAVYNGIGGVNTSPTAQVPDGNIAAGQSFFTTGIGSGTIQFTNVMRVAGENDQFFKFNNTTEKNRVWLNLTNDNGAFKQLLIGYVTDATNEYDARFDGRTFGGNPSNDFYSINSGSNLVIQGRALPFDTNDEVPLGFKTTTDGSFTISIDHSDGNLATQDIFIEDKLNATTYNLRKSDYTFTTVKGTFHDRFVLKYTNKTLGVDDFENTEGLFVSVKNKVISINANNQTITKVLVFDVLGKLLFTKKDINQSLFEIATLRSSNQILLVKTELDNGAVETRKVIF